jgi:hypothetical protein
MGDEGRAVGYRMLANVNLSNDTKTFSQ